MIDRCITLNIRDHITCVSLVKLKTCSLASYSQILVVNRTTYNFDDIRAIYSINGSLIIINVTID